MSEDFYSVWEGDVSRIATFVAKDFPDVDAEDISQEMMLWLWEKGRVKFNNPDAAGASTALFWLAKKIAGDYRRQHLTISSQYSYKTSDVKQILESIFSVEDWATAFIPEDCRAEEFDEHMAIYSDVAWAYENLPAQYQNAIYGRYYHGIEYESDSNGRRTLNRAIEKLADVLNTYSRGDRRRVAISNANARYIIANANDVNLSDRTVNNGP